MMAFSLYVEFIVSDTVSGVGKRENKNGYIYSVGPIFDLNNNGEKEGVGNY